MESGQNTSDSSKSRRLLLEKTGFWGNSRSLTNGVAQIMLEKYAKEKDRETDDGMRLIKVDHMA